MTTSLRTCVIALLAAALPACSVEGSGCVRTRTAARPADKVDLRAAGRSATIEATLTAAGEPLPGKALSFEVLDDGASLYEAGATTGRDGTARVDLKRADPQALVALARADEFRATFAGDGEHCGSADDAPIRIVSASRLLDDRQVLDAGHGGRAAAVPPLLPALEPARGA